MRKFEIDLYTFNELNEDVQKNILKNDSFREEIVDMHFSYMLEDLRDELNTTYNIGSDNIHDLQIEYSLCYCQGDGLCFYGKNILSYTNLRDKTDCHYLEKYLLDNLTDKELEDLIMYLNEDYNFNIVKKSWHYSHKNTCAIECEYYYNDDTEIEDRINALTDKVCKLLRKPYDEICDALEKIGYGAYHVDDEEIIDYLVGNDVEFDINGNLWH